MTQEEADTCRDQVKYENDIKNQIKLLIANANANTNDPRRDLYIKLKPTLNHLGSITLIQFIIYSMYYCVNRCYLTYADKPPLYVNATTTETYPQYVTRQKTDNFNSRSRFTRYLKIYGNNINPYHQEHDHFIKWFITNLGINSDINQTNTTRILKDEAKQYIDKKYINTLNKTKIEKTDNIAYDIKKHIDSEISEEIINGTITKYASADKSNQTKLFEELEETDIVRNFEKFVIEKFKLSIVLNAKNV
jgi:hypothetical protein